MAVQLTPAQEQRLQDLAVQSGRTPDEFTREFVDRFLDYQEHYIAAVHQGIASADRGELTDHDEVMSLLDQIIENG
jgi:predicted transcriptional regulator